MDLSAIEVIVYKKGGGEKSTDMRWLIKVTLACSIQQKKRECYQCFNKVDNDVRDERVFNVIINIYVILLESVFPDRMWNFRILMQKLGDAEQELL